MDDLAERLREHLKNGVTDLQTPRDRRIFIRVRMKSFRDAIMCITNKLGIKHLSAITGIDLVEEIELQYHFAHNGSVMLSLGVPVPKSSLRIPTVTDLIPGAVFYEREVHEFFGVEFESHPDLSPLILPERWPEGVYPLRKENDYDKLHGISMKGA